MDFARGMRESKAMLERERWPRERIEAFQRERLAELTAYAAERSPFWRERLPRWPRLDRLPVLTKDELIGSFDELVTDRRLRLDDLLHHLDQIDDDALYLDEFRVMTSSGSSGRKAVFVYDRAAGPACAAMFMRRSAWIGIRPSLPRQRLAMVWGASPTHMSRRGAVALDVGVHRLCPLDVTQPLPELVARLNEFQPQQLSAYPSIAAQLADEQLAGRLRLRLEGLDHQQRAAHPRRARAARAGLRRAHLQLLRHHRGALRQRLRGRLDAPARRHVHRRERRRRRRTGAARRGSGRGCS